MFIGLVQIAMYHYDMHVKVAYDNFENKRRYDDTKPNLGFLRFLIILFYFNLFKLMN